MLLLWILAYLLQIFEDMNPCLFSVLWGVHGAKCVNMSIHQFIQKALVQLPSWTIFVPPCSCFNDLLLCFTTNLSIPRSKARWIPVRWFQDWGGVLMYKTSFASIYCDKKNSAMAFFSCEILNSFYRDSWNSTCIMKAS